MTNQTNKHVVRRLREIEQETVSTDPSGQQREDSTALPGESAKQLVELLGKYNNRPLLVAMRGYPDPDSIASAMAVSHIARTHGANPTILYVEDISHYENRALVKTLGVKMVQYQQGFEFEQYDGIVLVDSQSLGIPGLVRSCPVLAIIDHHKVQGESNASFVDIRADVGSTCTMVAEYLAAGAAPLELDNQEHQRIATAMLIGIRSDTDAFFSALEADFAAAAFLIHYTDRELMRKVANLSISPTTMEVTQRAFASRIVSDTFLLSGVGFVREEDRDSIGQAADYLLRREGIDSVIVYGIVADHHSAGDCIDGSLRTKSDVVDPDKFIKDSFGTDPYGTPFGGGRRDKGAFKIPLGPFAACTNRDLLWRFVKHTIEDLFFEKLGINRERPSS